MGILKTFIGPVSKYDRSIPYTYEARIPIIEGEEEFNYYLSDTICGLVEYLDNKGITPEKVMIFEIYQDQQRLIPGELYRKDNGDWLNRPDICRSFEEHYKGHIHGGECSFADRERKGIGP